MEQQQHAGVDPAEGGSGKLSVEQISAAAWDATMQGLAGTWPHLRQLLLAAAVQRLCTPAPSTSGDSAAQEGPKESSGATSRQDALVQWVGRLLGATRGEGQRRGRQQKVGSKRKSSQADIDAGGQREQWRPSFAQLEALLASCLRALAASADVQTAQFAQKKTALLRKVAAMLLEQMGSAQEGLGNAVQQLQQLLDISTVSASEQLIAKDGREALVHQLAEALQKAQAAQTELMQRAHGATSPKEFLAK